MQKDLLIVSPDQITPTPAGPEPNQGNPPQPIAQPQMSPAPQQPMPSPLPSSQPQSSPLPQQPAPTIDPPVATSTPQVYSFDVPEVTNTNPGSQTITTPPPTGPISYGQLNQTKPKNKKKIVIGVGAGSALVVLLLSGYIFGYHIPNQPANVWKTSLSRSGKALDQIVNTASEKETVAAYEKSEMKATIDISAEGAKVKGSVDVKFGDSKADANIDVSLEVQGEAEKKLNTKLLFELPDNASYPNTYFKVDGIKAFGIDELSPMVAEFDNKWIAIEAEYLKSLGAPATSTDKIKNEQLNSEDISEIARSITSVASSYVFTAEADRAIFVQKSFVGKEKIDNINTYHYTVGINNENAKKFCEALTQKLYSTKGYRKLNGGTETDIEKSKESDIKNCRNDGNTFKESDTYDLWVDSKYKLIHKIRFTNNDNAEAYTEIGQTYKGGDDISMFINYQDGKQDTTGKFTLDTNLKTKETKGALTFNGKGTSPYDVSMTMQAKPYTGNIAIKKPANAIPIEQVLQKFGIDPKEQFAPADPNVQIESNPSVNSPLTSATLERITFSPSGIKSLKDAIDTSMQTSGITPAINDAFDPTIRGSKIISTTENTPSTTQKITRIILSLLNQ